VGKYFTEIMMTHAAYTYRVTSLQHIMTIKND